MKWLTGYISILLGLYCGNVMSASPVDARVVHGSVDFANPSANVLQITNSPSAIINWQQFNIDQNELVRFIQQTADSAVLNRVTGQDPSAILGGLESNGRVFVINPNGIVFGENARINTAGLLASSLNISDEDFLNGHYRFSGNAQSGAIENNGYLLAGPGGEIILIAPQIRNAGTIRVDDGNLILAAGEKITLNSLDLNGIQLEVQAPGNEVINLGTLIAEKGAIGVFADSISQQGHISANSIEVGSGGEIILRAQSDIEVGDDATISANGVSGGDITLQSLNGDTVVRGMIEAMGEGNWLDQLDPEDIRYERFTGGDYRFNAHGKSGGDIFVLGNQVGLFDSALINASGLGGGGQVLIGGDYRGENPNVQNATATFVSQNARINANSLLYGDGGRIIVWGTDSAQIHGAISAMGGPVFGDGGFVETSGHYLSVTHTPDVSAVDGVGGTWLLDPYNITIISGAGTLDAMPTNNIVAGADSSTIGVGVIQGALNSNGTVVIDTNSGQGSTQPGNVTFNAPIIKSLGTIANLQVRADGDIIVASSITSTSGSLNIDFISDRNLDGSGGMEIRSQINTNGGAVRLVSNGALGTGQGILMFSSGELNTGGASIDIFVGAGPLEVADFTNSRIRSTGQINITTNSFILPTTPFDDIGATNANITITPVLANGTIGLGGNSGDLILAPNELDGFTAATITLGSATGGNILIGDNVVIGSNISNGVTLRSGSDISFAALSGQNGLEYATGVITLDAGGEIFRNNANTGYDLLALGLDVTAANGIRLDTHVDTLSYNNTTDGQVSIDDVSTNDLSIISGNSASSSGFTTLINETSASLFIDGPINTTIPFGIVLTSANNITNNSSISSASGIALSAAGTITNNGTISSNGAIGLDAGSSGLFVNGVGAVISNNNVSGADITVLADDIDLQTGSSIDSGALAKVIFKPLTSNTTYALGNTPSSTGEIGLTAAELNSVSGNLHIGDLINTIGVSVDDALVLGGLNLFLEANGPIDINATLRVANNLGLFAAGTISQPGGLITADLLQVESDTGITLNNVSNDVNALTATVNSLTGSLTFSDIDGFQIRGIDFTLAPGDVNLFANGAITQASGLGNEVEANNLVVEVASDANAGVSLNHAQNTITGSVTLRTIDSSGNVPSLGDISFANNADILLGSAETLSDISLSTSGAISQSGAIRSAGLVVNAGTGIVLTDLQNRFTNLVATNNTAGQVAIRTSTTNLTIVPTGVQNLSTASGDNVVVINAGGGITVDGLISAQGGSVTLRADATANSDITVNTDVLANQDLILTASRDVLVNGTSIGGPGVFVESLSGDVNVDAGRNLRLQGGTQTGQSAVVQALNTINLTLGGNLTLIGGDGDQARADLKAASIVTQSAIGGNLNMLAGSGLDASATMHASNNITLGILGNARLNGGSGVDASAVISNESPGDALNVDLNILGNLTLLGGSGADAAAAIGTDDSNISITIAANALSLTSGAGGGTDPGAIAAIGALASGNNADVTIQARSNVVLNSNASSIALIGSELGAGMVSVVAGFNENEGNIEINDGMISSSGNVGLLANAGINEAGDIYLNGGTLQAGNLVVNPDGQFLIDDGLVAVTGSSLINAPFVMHAGSADFGTSATINGDYTQDGGTSVFGDVTFNNNVALGNASLSAVNLITTSVDGSFTLDGGTLEITNTGQLDTAFILNSGLYDISGNIVHASSFTQNDGWTQLNNARLEVAGNFELVDGVLSGTGTIVTETLNHIGGKIAPGSNLGPLPTEPVSIGALVINGDLLMGGSAELSFDLAGAQNLGGQAGIDYDLLRVNGHASLNGELHLTVDVDNYRASLDDFFAPLRFESVAGEFTRVIGYPDGYGFNVRLRDNGLGVITTHAPGQTSNVRIPEDELETLLNDFEQLVEQMHQVRRARRLQRLRQEQEEKEEDQKERKALICSI